MAFDYEGARAAGYSDAEIVDHLAAQSNFDANSARVSGYKDQEIIDHLLQPKAQEEKGYARRALEAVPSGLEGGVRTGINMAGNILGFAPSYLLEKALGNPDAAETALHRFSEGFENVPRMAKDTAQVEEMISKGMEKVMEYGGTAAVKGAEALAPGGELGMKEEALVRGGGEILTNFLPIPIIGRGLRGKGKAAEAAEPAPRAEGNTAQFDPMRQAMPELKDKTDAEIIQFLEAQDAAVRGEQNKALRAAQQQDLFTPEELAEKRKAEIEAAQREAAQGELKSMLESQELLKREESGTRDMFGEKTGLERNGTRSPRTQPEAPLEPEATPVPTPDSGLALIEPDALPYENPIKNYLAQRVGEVVERLQQNPQLAGLVQQASFMVDQLQGQLDRSLMGDPVARARVNELSKVMEEMDTIVNQVSRQERGAIGDLEAFNRWLTKDLPAEMKESLAEAHRLADKAGESTLGLTPEKVGDIKEALNQRWTRTGPGAFEKPQGPGKGVGEPRPKSPAVTVEAARKEGAWARWFQRAEADQRLTQERPETLGDALRIISESGTPIQKAIAKALSLKGRLEHVQVTFGDQPRRSASITSEKTAPYPNAAGRYYPEGMEILVRWKEGNQAGILLHEATHSVLVRAIGHFTEALKKSGSWAHDLQKLAPQYIPLSRLNTIFEAVRSHRMKSGADKSTLHIDNAFKDLDEFSSDLMSDPKLADYLKSLKLRDLNLTKEDLSGTRPNKSVWSEIWTAVRDFVNPDKSLDVDVYSEAMEAATRAIDQVTTSEQSFHFKGFDDPKAVPGPNLKGALPEQFKHLAKHLEQRGQQVPESAERAVIDNPPSGVEQVTNRFTPDLRAWGEVRQTAVGLKDISGSILERIGQRLVSGSKMYSWIKEHPVLKWAVDTAYDAKKNVESRTQQLLRDPETGLTTKWESLTRKEQAQLGDVVLDGKKNKVNFTDKELTDRGLTPKQIDAYRTGRKMFDTLFAEFNAERIANHQEPVAAVPGYWPSRWQGNWQFFTYAKNANGSRGRLLRVDRADNKHRLAAISEMVKKDGKYDVTQVEATPRGKEAQDSFGLFNHIMETVGRDTPEGRALSQAMDRYAQELADRTGRLYRRHFEPSYGVEGYLGDPFKKDSQKAAKELIRSAEGYVKDGLDWMYSSRAGRELGNFHREAEAVGLSNVAKFSQMNWRKLNNEEGKVAHVLNRAMEIPMEELGLDRHALKKIGIDIKRETTMLMLAYFRPIFLMAQFVQPHQFVPSAIGMLEGRTGRSSKTGTLALGFKAHGDAFNAITGKFDGPDGARIKASIEYLKENRIVDPHFLDAAHDLFSRELSKIGSFVRGESAMAFAERYARTNAFFQFERWLSESHLEMSQKQRFDTAAELAEGSMTNYRRFERAQIFHDLGFVGDMASGLMTFKINLASQLYMYMKEAMTKGNAKPLVTLLAVQAIYAGTMGMPGREEMDSLINIAKQAKLLPAKFPTVTEFILRSANKIEDKKVADTVRYGPFSGATGIDISPTFSAGALLPDTRFSSWFPVLNKAGKIAGAGLDVIQAELGRISGGQGATRSDWWNLAKQGAPTSLQGAVERGMQDPRTGIIPDPAEAMEGAVTRPTSLATPEWAARGIAVKPTKESTLQHAQNQVRQSDAVKKSLMDGSLAKAKKLQADGKPWTDQLKEYVEVGGDPTTFINQVVGANKNIYMDQKTREALKSRSTQQIQRLLQLRSMYRD